MTNEARHYYKIQYCPITWPSKVFSKLNNTKITQKKNSKGSILLKKIKRNRKILWYIIIYTWIQINKKEKKKP